MTSVETTGNTVEEAKRKALEQLGVTDEHQVQFEVLDEGKRSLLGILVSPARVRATLLEPSAGLPSAAVEENLSPEVARQVANYVDQLLRRLPLNLQAVLRGTHGRYVEIEMVGRDVSVLIGKNGEVINALQFLLNLMVPKATGLDARIVLDGMGWRRRRTERLRNQVIAIANEVKKRREEAVLPPMPPHERRIVHQTLKDDPEVITYSEGEEPNRYVVISPRESSA